MNVLHKDFIGYYRNVYPEGYCQHLINEFNMFESKGVGLNRQDSENALRHEKDDHQLYLNVNTTNFSEFNGNSSIDMFFNGLQECFNEYSNKYSTLKHCGHIRGTDMKMQRTRPGQGYHIWHAEQSSSNTANRILTYMLYLNTLPEDGAGETEFLYQQQRVKTEENLLLVWPAAYTHTHRGNPVYGLQDKYIVTGWFYIN